MYRIYSGKFLFPKLKYNNDFSSWFIPRGELKKIIPPLKHFKVVEKTSESHIKIIL